MNTTPANLMEQFEAFNSKLDESRTHDRMGRPTGSVHIKQSSASGRGYWRYDVFDGETHIGKVEHYPHGDVNYNEDQWTATNSAGLAKLFHPNHKYEAVDWIADTHK